MSMTDSSNKGLEARSDFAGGELVLYTDPACAGITTQRIPFRRPREGGDPRSHGAYVP